MELVTSSVRLPPFLLVAVGAALMDPRVVVLLVAAGLLFALVATVIPVIRERRAAG